MINFIKINNNLYRANFINLDLVKKYKILARKFCFLKNKKQWLIIIIMYILRVYAHLYTNDIKNKEKY